MNLPHLRRILIVVCLLIVLSGLLRKVSADSDYITIVSFTATPGAGQILVEWETASEINVVSFCIQRSLQEGGDFTRISECVPAKGDISATFYQITDTDVVAGTRYYYRLEVINTGGTAEYYGPISAVAGAPAGRTWHIATTGSDITGDGSETQPFATIQHGIDSAENDDTVLVHPGVYTENINFNGKNITVGSLFITTGNEDTILQTVIDGNRSGRVVTFTNGETATATLSGFTITNGYAQGASEPASYGGGIYCHYADPTLTHLRVTGNEADGEGGGLHFRDSSPTVRDILVTNNHANGGGGGIRYTGGSVNLENAVVTHNSARSDGAGIHFYHADGTIKNALIADNSGASKGGGLGFDGCSPTFINVTIAGNRTTGNGGGLNVSYFSQPTLVNSIVWGRVS